MNPQWLNDRNLFERIVVTGELCLETPTHLGNGDSDGLLDMPLHLDSLKGHALLTGTSLAGALRNYLYRSSPALASKLFGDVWSGPDDTKRSEESRLIIDDALGGRPQVELRDGVAIDPKTRTASDRQKYDIELLQAGTVFPLSFELLLCKKDARSDLLQAFALALSGLEEGAIPLGKRKRRGYGRCKVDGWRVRRYNMSSRDGLVAWLAAKSDMDTTEILSGKKIAELLGVGRLSLPPSAFTLDAFFAVDGSLLIRSAPPVSSSADTVHLRSERVEDGKRVPRSILSGTSVAGALRARALRIANTLGKDGEAFVNDLFGYRPKGKGDKTPMSASRVWVAETVIEDPIALVQTRVKIDRFTGGSFPGALFAEEAVFGGDKTRVRLQVTLQEDGDPIRQDADIGLLLLLLKDLWTGDLPLGGESSIGRGRLQGEYADITIGTQQWTVRSQADQLLDVQGPTQEGTTDALERYVQAFGRWQNANS